MPHGASTVNSFNSPCARCTHVLAETHVVPFGAVSSSDCLRERNREHVLLLPSHWQRRWGVSRENVRSPIWCRRAGKKKARAACSRVRPLCAVSPMASDADSIAAARSSLTDNEILAALADDDDSSLCSGSSGSAASTRAAASILLSDSGRSRSRSSSVQSVENRGESATFACRFFCGAHVGIPT